MAELALAELRAPVRVLVGDGGNVAIGFDYEDGQVDEAIKLVVNMGWLPCVAVKTNDPTRLDPAPPNRATFGWLVAKAAHMLLGGEKVVSYKTRALSVFQDPAARRDALTFIETMLSDLDGSGNVCGTADDVEYQGLFATAADLATYSRVGGCPGDTPTFPCCY